MLFSFGDGINSVTWALVGNCFGRTHFATIHGWIGMLQSLASMPAAVLTGFIYDRTESYTSALIVFVVSYWASGLILWWLPDPERSAPLGVPARQLVNLSP